MRPAALATEFDPSTIGTSLDWPSRQVLGRWRVLSALGRGGTAEVWHGVAPGGREAALKLVNKDLRGHAAANALLHYEHEVLRRVSSKHLVRPYELFEEHGVAVLALEYLPHGDLVSLAGAPPRRWLSAFAAVVDGLCELERHGLAHGDVKARNVLFAIDGTARLTDLTAARPLDAPAVATTAAYHCAAARGANARDADCFAVAALLYELLTGRPPLGLEDSSCKPSQGETPVLVDAAAYALLDVALRALDAGAPVPGLSCFRDVIESVRPAYA